MRRAGHLARRIGAFLAIAGVSLVASPAGQAPPALLAGGATAPIPARGMDLARPSGDLSFADILRFRNGKALFRKDWQEAAARGELPNRNASNANSCDRCHPSGGRSLPRQGHSRRSPLVDLVAFSRAASPAARTVQDIHPARSDADSPLLVLRWITEPLSGSEQSEPLSYPVIRDERTGETLSGRIAPPIYGSGLLEAIDVQDIVDWARARKSGRPSLLSRKGPNGSTMQILGRFGWKADAATVREIAERALTSELGLPALSELSETEREDLYFYTRELAVVARELVSDSAAHGFYLFESLGCAGCHRPSYVIDRAVSGKPFRTEIWPFTDLLLHDMGPRLAGAGSGAGGGDTEWRTPPLWGIGRTLSAHGRNAYLHDGRAKTVHEAILWHGGEGEAARSQYLRLAPDERRALVKFVESL